MCGNEPPLSDITEEERKKIPKTTDKLIVFEEGQRSYSRGGGSSKGSIGYHYTGLSYYFTDFKRHKERNSFNENDIRAFARIHWETKMRYWSEICDGIIIAFLLLICQAGAAIVMNAIKEKSQKKGSDCKYLFFFIKAKNIKLNFI